MPGVKKKNLMEKTERILAKGEWMTWNEVLYLRERGVMPVEIAEALGMHKKKFDRLFLEWKKEMGI